MAETSELKILINAQDNASKVLHGLAGTSQSVLSSVGKAAVTFAKVGAVAFAGFSVASVAAADEAQKSLNQLDAVLKSTGGTAGVTKDSVIALSKSLQKTTEFSDEAVLEAENLLLTFTKIGKETFPDATKTVLDMSVALGQDTKSSAVQLGKALQDPVLGITALRRVGVNFSDKQKEVIEKMVETGDTLGAQKLILKELNTEFGGSAAAAANTFGGSMSRLKNNVNDLMETFGTSLINFINPFVAGLADIASSKQAEDFIASMTWALSSLVEVAKLLISGDFQGGIFGLQEDDPIIDFIFSIREGFIALLDAGRRAFDFLKPALMGLVATLWPLLEAFGRLWVAIQPLLPILGAALVVALYGVITALTIAVQVVTFLINTVAALVTAVTTAVPTIMGWIAWLRDNWVQALGFIIGFMVTLPIKLPILMYQAVAGIVNVIRSINWGAVLSVIFNAFVAVWNKILSINWWEAGKNIAKGIGNGLASMLEGAIKGIFAGIPGASKFIGGFRLPRFAQGGYVPGKAGEPILAVLHGGEKVLSPNMQDTKSGGGGIVINMNGNFNLDSEQRVDELARRISQMLGRQTELAQLGAI